MFVKSTNERKGFLTRFIKYVEKVGNKLPHPFTLFTLLALITVILSFLLSQTDLSVTFMKASRNASEAPVETIVTIKNLLSYDSLRSLLANSVNTYIGFAPLGVVLTMTLGIGLIEQTGLFSALMRKMVLGVPSFMVTAVLAFVGVNSSIASDAGTIFSIAIGGALYKALGRNPKVGIITGFVAASAGFTANISITSTDPLLSGITQSVVDNMGISAPTHPLINYYFMFIATFVITLVVTFITEKFITKILGDKGTIDKTELESQKVTEIEKRGLRNSGIALIIFLAVIMILTVPQNSFFRNDDGGILPISPLMSSIVPLLFLLFFTIGLTYGISTKQIKSDADMVKFMQKGLSSCLSFLVVALPSAIFIQLFNESNLATVLSVKGAALLGNLKIEGIPLMMLFLLLTGFINLFITSGSAKWLILAPVFVPMLSMMGLSPALTQVIFRIADSSTNIISPLLIYIPVVISYMEQYKTDENEEIGMGSVISLTLPYSFALMIVLFVLVALWFLFGIPLGPGAYPAM